MSRRRSPYLLNVVSSSMLPLAGMAAMLLTTPVLLAALGQGDYGLWLFFFALMQWAGLARFGLDTALVRKLASLLHDPDGEQQVFCYAGTLFWTTLIIGILVLALGLCAFPWISAFLNRGGMDVESTRQAFLLIVATFIAGYVAMSFESLLFASEEYFVRNLLNIAVLGLQTGWILYAFRERGGLVDLAEVYFIFALLQLFLTGMLVNRRFSVVRLLKNFHLPILREIRGWSLQYSLISLAAVVIYKTDNIVIGLFISPEAVALYGISFKLIDQAFRLNWHFGEMLFPRFSRLHAEGNVEELRRLRGRMLGLTLVGSIVTGGGLFWVGPRFVELWVGRENLLEGSAFHLLVVSLLIGAVAHNSGVFINAVGYQKPMVIVCGIEALLNIGISLMLVRPYGYLGVALGTFVAHAVTTAWFNPWLAFRYGRAGALQGGGW